MSTNRVYINLLFFQHTNHPWITSSEDTGNIFTQRDEKKFGREINAVRARADRRVFPQLFQIMPTSISLVFLLRYQCTPNLIIFQKKCFSLFRIDPIAIFHLKKFYEKRLILSKVINEKRFFPLIISNG